MQSTFTVVVFGVVGLSLVMAIGFLLSGSSAYDQIGASGISRDSEHGSGGAREPPADSPAGRAERDREIRQMLQARSERLVRKGQPALDIDAELAKLTQSPLDPHEDAGLTAEVRQLVVARNERRARQGLQALDVESEVQRTLRELSPDA